MDPFVDGDTEMDIAELLRELIEPIAYFLDVSSTGRLFGVCKRLYQVPVQRVWRAVTEGTILDVEVSNGTCTSYFPPTSYPSSCVPICPSRSTTFNIYGLFKPFGCPSNKK
jgi:hypothetical protein